MSIIFLPLFYIVFSSAMSHALPPVDFKAVSQEQSNKDSQQPEVKQ